MHLSLLLMVALQPLLQSWDYLISLPVKECWRISVKLAGIKPPQDTTKDLSCAFSLDVLYLINYCKWYWIYNDVMMSLMASQITSLTTVYSNFYSRRRWKKTSKFRITYLCEGNSLVTSEFPAQRASNAENVSIWWRHDEMGPCFQ